VKEAMRSQALDQGGLYRGLGNRAGTQAPSQGVRPNRTETRVCHSAIWSGRMDAAIGVDLGHRTGGGSGPCPCGAGGIAARNVA